MTPRLDGLVLDIEHYEQALDDARRRYVAEGGAWMWSKQKAHAELVRARKGGDAGQARA